jgi:hypothetical protein
MVVFVASLDIRVYDCAGRLVRNLYSGTVVQPLNLTLTSSELPSGVLFIRLDAEGYSEVRKVVNVSE